MAIFIILTANCTKFSQNDIFNGTKRTQRIERNEFSKCRLYLNFTDHWSAMSRRAIILKFANIVPALIHIYTFKLCFFFYFRYFFISCSCVSMLFRSIYVDSPVLSGPDILSLTRVSTSRQSTTVSGMDNSKFLPSCQSLVSPLSESRLYYPGRRVYGLNVH